MIPVFLSLRNFVSHTESYLDFTQFDSAIVVGSHSGNPDISNGVGKTALFDAMCWALYGKSRFTSKNKVVQRGKSNCCVEFEFMLANDEKYKVVRRADLRSNLSDVTFYRKNGDEWDSSPYTADTNTMTTKNIIEKLGISYDAFVNVVYFKQNDIAGFASAQTSKRKDILKDILQIGVWDNCQKDAKVMEKRVASERDGLTSRINAFGDLDSEKEENLKMVKEALVGLDDAKSIVEGMEHQLHEYEEEIANLEIALSKMGATNRRRLEEKLQYVLSRASGNKDKRKALRDSVKKNNDKIVQHSNDSQQIQFKILELSKSISALGVVDRKDMEKLLDSIMESGSSEIPGIQRKRDELELRSESLKQKNRSLDSLRLQLTQLLSLSPGEECPTCLSSFDDVDSVVARREKKQRSLDYQIKDMEEEIEELEGVIQHDRSLIRNAESAHMEIQRSGLILAKHQTSINESERHNSNIQEELIELKEEWDSLKAKKIRLDALLSQSSNLNGVQKELAAVFDKKKSLLGLLENARKNVIECSIKHGHLEGYGEELERRSSERVVIVSQRDALTSTVEAYSTLVRIFGRDGIQAIIMENVTEDLRSYTNSILCHLSNDPMSVDFVTQKQTATGSWKEEFDITINMHNDNFDFGDLSGGEQVRVAFALRLALSRILMRRVGSNIKFLLLDEVDQSLDRYGIDVLVQTINSLVGEFKILVITHNEYMKEKFEHVISIQKGPAGSTLKQ